MDKVSMITGILVDDITEITFTALCQRYEISEEMLLDLLEHGLISEISTPDKALVFSADDLQRILSAYRLHRDLEINSPGVILALELLDELEDLRQQLHILQRHVQG